jgi:hypothetical protein
MSYYLQEGGADILFHGTSTFYIANIKKYGLLGKFPDDDLYSKAKYVWSIISGDKSIVDNGGYIASFIHRQETFRTTGHINISFTPDILVAKEFTMGRLLGEGMSRLFNCMVQFRSMYEFDGFDEFYELYDILEHALKYRGIILCIKRSDFPLIDSPFNPFDYVTTYETPIYEAITPDKLYIYTDTNNTIKLLSPEADRYIESLAPVDEDTIPELPALGKEHLITTEELVRFKIGYDGRSDIYKGYHFNARNAGSGKYYLTVTGTF